MGAATASRSSESPPQAPVETLRTLHLNTERTWRGGEQQTLYLIRGLARRGHGATLLCQPGSPLRERARAEAGADVRSWPSRGEVDPVAVARLAAALVRGRYDLVHCHTSHSHALAVAARLLARPLLGFGRRGPGPGRPPRILVTRRVDFSIYRRSFLGLNGLKYRAADGFIAISDAVRAVLVRDGIPGERVAVVHSGIDLERFAAPPPSAPDPAIRAALGVPPDAPLVGNVAHCAGHKGQRFLVEAAPLVLARRPDARLAIVGEGELRADLAARVRALGLDGRVLLPGFRDDIPAILRALDVFVLPSLEEALGTSILDAMAAGTPVVATRVGGIPEAVDEGVTGLMVPPADPPALAAAILRLLDDRALARRLAAAAAERVRRFSIDATVDGTVAVYHRLVSGRPVAEA